MSTLSADDAALLDRMIKKAGGRLKHKPPCVLCSAPAQVCRVTLPGVLDQETMVGHEDDSCDASALCFECAKAEYTAIVIAGA